MSLDNACRLYPERLEDSIKINNIEYPSKDHFIESFIASTEISKNIVISGKEGSGKYKLARKLAVSILKKEGVVSTHDMVLGLPVFEYDMISFGNENDLEQIVSAMRQDVMTRKNIRVFVLNNFHLLSSASHYLISDFLKENIEGLYVIVCKVDLK